MENRVFNPANRAKLESPERYRILPPFETLKGLCLKEDDIMIDIGCGTGYFTFPASEITGPSGRVIGVDISPVMLDEVRNRINGHSSNIELRLADPGSIPVDNNSGTYVLLANVLHEADDMERMLNEVKRVLKPGGRLAIVEWEKREMPLGPPIEHRLHQDDILELVNRTGFTMVKLSPAGDYHVACTAVKK